MKERQGRACLTAGAPVPVGRKSLLFVTEQAAVATTRGVSDGLSARQYLARAFEVVGNLPFATGEFDLYGTPGPNMAAKAQRLFAHGIRTAVVVWTSCHT